MDESAAPWRALEDVAPHTANGVPGPAASAGSAGAIGAHGTWIVAALVAAALAAGGALWLVASSGRGTVVVEGGGPVPGRSDRAGSIVKGSAVSASPANLVVDVQGAVARPGIVHLAAGARVADAITAAGGYGPRVAADRLGRTLNLAALVKDGDQVIVPSRDDGTALASSGATGAGGTRTSAAPSAAHGPIDLNHATIAELDSLPGIGPVTAAKIVAARDERAFGSIDDLRSRKILGAATFDKVKALVVVR